MHERIVRLKSRNNELRARVGEAQGNIERLETARTTISEEKPNVQDNRETLTRKALDGDEWRGNRKEEYEGLRDDIKAKFDEAESHIEQLLEDMKAKKAQLQSSIETMQNTMMLNELLIREERKKPVAEILFEKSDVEEKFSQLKNGANEFPADFELPSILTSELRTVEQFKEVEEMYHELIISYIAALGKGAETAWNNIQTLGEADEKLSQSMGS